MIYARKVKECDFNDITYDPPANGAAFLAQSATGRWCEVMHAGPEFLTENDYEVLSYDEAVAKAKEIGGEIDF